MIHRSIQHVVALLAVAGLMLFGAVAGAQEAASPPARAAIPAVEAQNDARKLLGNLFRADYERAKKPEEKAALAEKMLQVGSETRDDPSGQYMLFQIAKEIAIGAPSAETALRAIDAQGAIFEIDVPDAKLTTVIAIEKNLKFSKDRQALMGTLDQLVEEFLQAERYDLAKKGMTLNLDLARKIPHPGAIKQATTRLKEIEGREQQFIEVQAARKTLQAKPDDPAANLALGRFLCLVSGDWEQGLPLLAKGSDAKLKTVAQQELAQPREAEKQMDLADAWWNLSEQETGAVQNTLQQRALAWYQTALPKLSGLEKLKVTGRLEKAIAKADEANAPTSAALSRSTGSAAKPTPKVFTNSIGMKLVLIPAGTFTMGSPSDEAGRRDNELQHRVKLSKPFSIGMTEVTQGQWLAVMGTQPWQGQPKVQEGANNPASYISWQAANEFCRKLSAKEKKKYRLPTEAEWEYACRAGTKTPHYIQASVKFEDCAWYLSNAAIDKQGTPHEVGLKLPNPAGLYDMHGNVGEWCSDFMAMYPENDVVDPRGPHSGTSYIQRGGRCDTSAGGCRSARRASATADTATYGDGFRVVYDSQPPATAIAAKPALPPPAVAIGSQPTVAIAAGEQKDAASGEPKDPVIANTLGMKLVLLPAGKFMMGSPESEEGHSPDETQHEVTLTKPFYLATMEVTQGQFFAVMGSTPWEGKPKVEANANHAASCVSWDAAVEFCRKLGAQEKRTYRLPTEAEWEYACRAGTQTPHSFDASAQPEKYALCAIDTQVSGEEFAHEVGKKLPNARGLFDMHGNVAEWCSDWLGDYPPGPATNPQGPEIGTQRVSRGGTFRNVLLDVRSARRIPNKPKTENAFLGFRVVREP